jgi:hypothetical protein
MVEPGIGNRWIFSTAVAQQILALSAAIDCIERAKNRRLLRVVLGSVPLTVSNVIVNGKGRRYRENWAKRSYTTSLVVEKFRQRFEQVVNDITEFSSRACCDYKVLRGDSRKQLSTVDSIDLAVFSPPYPNSFDYTDIYNLELWMLGYLKTKQDNSVLRNQTLRSHVQIKRQFDTLRDVSPTLDQVYGTLVRARKKLWNRNIPEMVSSYFCDLALVLIDIHSKLRQNGRIFMAVGSSKYAGVFVDVPKITVELGTSAGLMLIDNDSIRSMRSSAQQGGRKELHESMLIFC